MFGDSESFVSSCATSLVVLLMFDGLESLIVSCHQFGCGTDVGGTEALAFTCATISLMLLVFGGLQLIVLLCHEFSCVTDVSVV
jgi:hypothetical protein